MTGTLVWQQGSLAFGLLLALAVSAGAHSGDRVFPIPELTDEMLAQIYLDDGSVEEWYELIGEPILTLLDFKEETYNRAYDLSDLDFRIWLAWNDNPARIYMAFVASDDVYINVFNYGEDRSFYAAGRNMMFNDNVVLAIDADHSGGQGLDWSEPLEDRIEYLGETQLYIGLASVLGGGPSVDFPIASYTWTGTIPWAALLPYAEGGGGVNGENPTIQVVAMYVTPWDHWEGWDRPDEIEVSDFTAGQIVGFGTMVFDFDYLSNAQEESDPWSRWIPQDIKTFLPFTDIFSLRADVFLDGLLLPADPTEPESAVESVTWGRIKAALEME